MFYYFGLMKKVIWDTILSNYIYLGSSIIKIENSQLISMKSDKSTLEQEFLEF